MIAMMQARNMLGSAGVKSVLALALLLILVVIFGNQFRGPPQADESPSPTELSGDDYLRAVHWFGNDWPVNFWNTDLESRAVAHLTMAKADGFNTVVLLIPWPGFAPDPRSGHLDPERVRRLRELIRIADDQGFRVIVRLSYAWDWSDASSGERMLKLWLDETYYAGWLAYIESLWGAVGDSTALEFGFFSWEDLWAITSVGDADASFRRMAADASGFAQWAVDNYGLQGAGELLGQELSNLDEMTIPQRREPAWSTFMEFVSESWVDRFFLPAQKRFPKLSKEIRIDSDPIYDGDELLEWFDHRPNWNLPGADWVTLYWSPSMGGPNEGEVLSPQTGAERLDWWLDEVAEYAGTRQIFIGQFLVEDFTPGYERNGRIPTREIPEFLDLAQSTLQQKTGGFGLWTWVDYAHDAIANPEFYSGLDGWETSDGLSAANQIVHMEAGDWIATGLARFFYQLPDGTATARLCVVGRSARPSTLAVFEDQSPRPSGLLSFDAEPEERCIEHSLTSRHLRLLAEAPLEVHRVSSTGFVQNSGMRDLDFLVKPVAPAWRTLNEKLQYRPRLRRSRYNDGWMGAVMVESIPSAQASDSKVVLHTHLPLDWPVRPRLRVSVNGEFLGAVPCVDSGVHHLVINERPESIGDSVVRVESSTVYQPPGDERALGCLLTHLGLVPDKNADQSRPEN